MPKERDIIIANATTVRLYLLNWPNGDCPIEYYTVEFRKKVGAEQWNLVTSQATDNIIIRDLKPATWYSLRLTAHNDAGSTQALMDFATTTLSGVSIGPINDLVMDEDSMRSASSYKALYVAIPLACTIILIVSAVVVGYVMLKRNGRLVFLVLLLIFGRISVGFERAAKVYLSILRIFYCRGNYLGDILPGQQQTGLGLNPQHQPHHHLSSCMSTVQLKSTAERDNRRNHQVYTSSPVKQDNHKPPVDHGSGKMTFYNLCTLKFEKIKTNAEIAFRNVRNQSVRNV